MYKITNGMLTLLLCKPAIHNLLVVVKATQLAYRVPSVSHPCLSVEGPISVPSVSLDRGHGWDTLDRQISPCPSRFSRRGHDLGGDGIRILFPVSHSFKQSFQPGYPFFQRFNFRLLFL